MSPALWSDIPTLRRYYDRLGKNLKLRPAAEAAKFEDERRRVIHRIMELVFLYTIHAEWR